MRRINPADFPGIILLLLGTLLLTLTHLRFGIQTLAWIVYVPYFLYLRKTKGWKSLALFFAFLFIGWTLATMKILTGDMPWFFSFIYALPISILHLFGYLSIRWFKNNRYWWLIGASTFAISEWLLGAVTPFGTWGSLAYARVDDQALIQAGSLFGVSFISFLILIVNTTITYLLESGHKESSKQKAITTSIILLTVTYLYGRARIAIYEGTEKETISIATIDHDESGFSLLPQNVEEYASRSQQANVRLTVQAANAGAKYISWMEGSTVVLSDEEELWKNQLSELARELGIHLISAYLVPLRDKPLLMANKIAWFRPDGSLDHEYEKNVPVPSEPVRKGELPPQPVNIESQDLIMSAAICYDYDFPSIAHHIGKMKADVVFLPSGDWRGIDPYHSQMSAFRAIENGHSIIRPANNGMSSAISPVGRILGWRSDFDTPAGFLLADVPSKKIWTLYTIIGEWGILIQVITVFAVALPGKANGILPIKQ